ncbi:MAG TPA: RDD family protein [Flavobacterium sp.]|nr:RDD family protein [Flavobacterium sp.]HAT75307.1 RDD family protein [Flavobacterium sp.]HAT81282.1 RDD family protein [Flavobacterium sp.]
MEQREFQVTDELLASKGQRLLNYIIDSVIIYSTIFGLSFITALIADFFEANGFLEWLQNINKLEEYLIYFLIMIPYFTLMESIFSKSIGKFVTNTMVVLEDGTKPESSIILKRTLCRIIPFDALSFLGTPSRGWHDSITDTYVVRKDDFERSKELFYALDEIGINQDES